MILRTMLIYRNIILVSTLGIMPLCNGRNQKVLLKTGKLTNDRGKYLFPDGERLAAIASPINR
ncbi:hypothetical protein; putative exported protein [Xenorhabdus bovienii str. kraussei Quebec]|uniref:Uncharacterized protein n=1 Tax=Xenorhabdus bovienii str. kraussei Quebec TaxID=1398203 RepID=A0A077PCB1_XENBV|nr:hypothetical protein; putative exported protein [Xenorhabdus bovienii str. kraussei Quebec]